MHECADGQTNIEHFSNAWRLPIQNEITKPTEIYTYTDEVEYDGDEHDDDDHDDWMALEMQTNSNRKRDEQATRSEWKDC